MASYAQYVSIYIASYLCPVSVCMLGSIYENSFGELSFAALQYGGKILWSKQFIIQSCSEIHM